MSYETGWNMHLLMLHHLPQTYSRGLFYRLESTTVATLCYCIYFMRVTIQVYNLVLHTDSYRLCKDFDRIRVLDQLNIKKKMF